MIKDVKIFQPDRFEDFRGDIYTTWNNETYPDFNWRLDKFAHSRKDVLRGVHGDVWLMISQMMELGNGCKRLVKKTQM